MNYTIATTKDATRDYEVSIYKDGKGYIVSISGNGEFTSRYFDNLDDAFNRYEAQVMFIVFGLYADKDRREILKGE